MNKFAIKFYWICIKLHSKQFYPVREKSIFTEIQSKWFFFVCRFEIILNTTDTEQPNNYCFRILSIGLEYFVGGAFFESDY